MIEHILLDRIYYGKLSSKVDKFILRGYSYFQLELEKDFS